MHAPARHPSAPLAAALCAAVLALAPAACSRAPKEIDPTAVDWVALRAGEPGFMLYHPMGWAARPVNNLEVVAETTSPDGAVTCRVRVRPAGSGEEGDATAAEFAPLASEAALRRRLGPGAEGLEILTHGPRALGGHPAFGVHYRTPMYRAAGKDVFHVGVEAFTRAGGTRYTVTCGGEEQAFAPNARLAEAVLDRFQFGPHGPHGPHGGRRETGGSPEAAGQPAGTAR